MKTAQEWIEADIQALIVEQRPEDLSLEYKAAGALGKSDKKKDEISKDVSAMANSAGGTLVYGLNEQKDKGGPIVIDPIDPAQISLEWLEQVIDSGIQRRIPELRTHLIEISSHRGKFVYVVSIPPSNVAPHMAADHRFHKRIGTITAMMEEYEVRDVSLRLQSPDLALFFTVERIGGFLKTLPTVENISPAPALYASIRLFIPPKWTHNNKTQGWSPSNSFEIRAKLFASQKSRAFFYN